MEQLKHDDGSAQRIDELQREVTRLQERLDNALVERDKHRVLILADSNDSIEVYADQLVRVHVGCLPESHGTEEQERAVEFALKDAPAVFQNIVHDPAVRPEVYSTRCLTRGEWMYAVDRRAANRYLDKLKHAFQELTKPQPTEGALSAPSDEPPTGEIPF